MLNREQLERAAKYLCKIRGIHPDNIVLMNTFPSRDYGFMCPEWENVAREIEAHELLSEAIRYGRESSGG